MAEENKELLAVHIDRAGAEVDVHGLAPHGDDPLDQRVAATTAPTAAVPSWGR